MHMYMSDDDDLVNAKKYTPTVKTPASPWERRKCGHCKKYLQAVGDRRKNGKKGVIDRIWRCYHRKCFKMMKSMKSYN